MNCPKCTVELLPNGRFCGSCGFTLVQEPAAQQPPQNPQSQPAGAFHFDADGRGQGRGYTWEINIREHLPWL